MTHDTSSSLLSRDVPPRRYLPELHGVRGLALLGVVLFHLFGTGRVSGGIDIFLAVTGFLFTGMLLREATASGGTINLLRYVGRLLRRIVAPAAIVIVTTLAAGLAIRRRSEHTELWGEAQASLLYYENIHLVNAHLSYEAASAETSPFQHFWSLSVQGQFYLVWPVVAMLSVVLARGLKASAGTVMAIITGGIFGASFGYALYVGSYDQAANYLMTTTRAWELAFGAILAFMLAGLRLPPRARMVGGWSGIALIVSCGFVLDGAELFPGPAALWPLAGLTLVMISAGEDGGDKDPRYSATRMLTTRPMTWIADRSYGIYLWHWPLLIYSLDLSGEESLSWYSAMFIMALTLLLASLTYRCVEQPLARLGKTPEKPKLRQINWVTVGTGALALTVGLTAPHALAPAPLTASEELELRIEETYEKLGTEEYPGAEAARLGLEVEEAPVVPELDIARSYSAEHVRRGCEQAYGDEPGTEEVIACMPEPAPQNPTATIVLAGGSHAGHWEAAFKNLAPTYGWEIIVASKSACFFGREQTEGYPLCGDWSHNFIDWLEENDHVDLVVTPGSRIPASRDEYIHHGAPYWWDQITGTGTNLLLIRGTPRQEDRVPECLIDGGDSQSCGMPKDRIAEVNPLEETELPHGARTIDMLPYVCSTLHDDSVENCEAIVGNVLVSNDRDHLTDPYSWTLGPSLEQELREVYPELF